MSGCYKIAVPFCLPKDREFGEREFGNQIKHVRIPFSKGFSFVVMKS